MSPAHPRDLLLAPELAPATAAEIFATYGFRDALAADADLQRIADEPRTRRLLADIAEPLLASASASADPDQALSLFERFARASVNRVELLHFFAHAPGALDTLLRALGASPFMAEILIRHTGYLYWLTDPEVLGHARPAADLRHDLAEAIAPLREHTHRLDALRQFKRREMLHIGVRDLLGLSTVHDTLTALSQLAEVLTQMALDICAAHLLGQPLAGPPSGASAEHLGFAVIALGKLGGSELNFSSDIDLLYVSDTTRTPHMPLDIDLSVTVFHDALARALTAALAELTAEGHVYRVDLRLRPEGRVGPLVSTLDYLRDYYSQRGATWERLALVRAWPIAGDPTVGRTFLSTVEPFVYHAALAPSALADVRDVKARIDRAVAERGQSETHVKLGLGGIREIELIAQSLQVAHGHRQPQLRERSTLAALTALARAGRLSASEHSALATAYAFLRDLENKLQMVHDTQSHELPASPDALRLCARRLGYRDEGTLSADLALLRDYRAHTARVSAVFQAHFDPSAPSRFATSEASS